MLKKLFKYEWKDSWKIVGGLNEAVLLLSLLSCLLYRESFLTALENNAGLSAVFALYNILYFGVIIALSLVTGLYFYYRFYRNLYTDEGYLMHTLPVNAHQLIWAKTFVAVIWKWISSIVLILAFFIFIGNMVGQDGYSLADIWRELRQELSIANIPSGAIGIIVIFVLMMLVAPFYSLFIGYLAISLGQLTKKHRLLAAVLFYFGISYAIQAIMTVFSTPFVSFMDSLEYISPETAIFRLTVVMLVILLVLTGVSVACYFLTHMVMRNKLNLE